MKNYHFLLLALFLISCNQNEIADSIITNADIYFPESRGDLRSNHTAAIKDGLILASGTDAEMKAYEGKNTLIINAENQFLMPGFIEGHGHFSGLGRMLNGLNFLQDTSWADILEKVKSKVENTPKGNWIEGRGWHQEKWKIPFRNVVSGYPTSEDLDSISPDHPVILFHASGHGLFANRAAMDIAGIDKEFPNPTGGNIIRGPFGEATGVFEENAQHLIRDHYKNFQQKMTEEELKARWINWIESAEEECLRKGITSFQDAGSSYNDIKWYKELANNNELDLRLWVMLRHSYDDMNGNMAGLPVKDVGEGFFTCKAIKTEVDGALGAHGAWLLNPYEDRPNFVGQNTTTIEEVSRIATLATQHNMQLCVHAIGDRANREVLDIMEREYGKVSSENPDLRWRIEHAQHLSLSDIPRFKSIGVIASMQGIHCTSDAPFVEKRLGEKRSREGAYPWRSLLDAGVVIANGTDAPVEDVDPIASFYASVTRKRVDSGMTFFTEQSMTREEAIHSYTLGNAFAAFEEDVKGSIEIGKYADLVLLSKNLLTCSDDEILEAKVLKTIVGGKIKYESVKGLN